MNPLSDAEHVLIRAAQDHTQRSRLPRTLDEQIDHHAVRLAALAEAHAAKNQTERARLVSQAAARFSGALTAATAFYCED